MCVCNCLYVPMRKCVFSNVFMCIGVYVQFCVCANVCLSVRIQLERLVHQTPIIAIDTVKNFF